MNDNSHKIYISAILFAICFAGSAIVYKYYFYTQPKPEQQVPTLGEIGSAHTHASLLILLSGRVVSFCDPQYMERSPLVHFENGDCFVVHSHVSGITLPMFLKTIGVELSNSCITLPDDGKQCANESRSLSVVINGVEISIKDIAFYEFKNNDHILINMGSEKGAQLRLNYNQVPMIPLDINIPNQ